MSAELLDAIRKRLPSDCIVTRCREGKCSVNIGKSLQPFILIDMNCKGLRNRSKTRCDFIFIGGSAESWVVPIELKGTEADLDQVARQLQAGARFAERVVPHNISVRFLPVLASKGIRKGPRGRLKQASNIKFREYAVVFERIECGDSLVSALQKIEKRK